MTDPNREYEKFNFYKNEVEDIFTKSIEHFKVLGMENQVQKITKLRDKVRSDNFKVMVVGLFKAGKSTLINSMLGDEILPDFATPCTAVINEVKYSNNKKAVLYFKDPIPENSDERLPRKAKSHISKYGSEDIPTMEISVDELEDYVVIPESQPDTDQGKAIQETPYEKVELFWPLDLLKNGVEIIDSPGLNEFESRTRITMNYLSNIDAVIFVLSALQPCGANEMEFIEDNILEMGHKDVFFVFNRINQVRPRERERVINHCITRLQDKTGFGKSGIFFISALDALDGRLDNDEEQFKESGVGELEDLLSYFLTKERGKVKLMQPTREYMVAVKEAITDAIPKQQQMLNDTIEEIEQRFNAVKPKLEDLERKKQQISEKIAISIEKLQPEIKALIESNISMMLKNIPTWCDTTALNNEIQLTKAKESAQKIVEELLQSITRNIQGSQNKWQKEVLIPQLSEKIKEMTDSFEGNIEDFYIDLDKIKMDLIGNVNINDTAGIRDVSTGERVGAALVGLLACDLGSAIVGGSFGFSGQLFKQIGLQIGAVVAMMLIGVTNPVTMIPVILGIAAYGIISGKGGMEKKLRKTVSSKIVEAVKSKSPETINNATNEIIKEIQERSKTIITTLDDEIKGVRNQMEAILNDKRAGEQQVAAKKKLLDQITEDFGSMQKKLEEINQSLAV